MNKLSSSSVEWKCPQADFISLDSIHLAGIAPVAHVYQPSFHSLSSENVWYSWSDFAVCEIAKLLNENYCPKLNFGKI